MENKDIFAAVQSLSINHSYNECYTLSVDIVSNSYKIFELFDMANKNPFNTIRARDKEFLCLWCDTPNPIEHVVCSRCGAPRGYIIK